LTDTTTVLADNAPGAKPKRAIRARLLTLNDLDGRTAAYRETRKLIDEIEADLGGADRLSTAERQIVQRAAVLGAIAADTEARWIDGQPFDPVIYCTVINAQRRLLETIGLKRRPRDVTPDLKTYLAQKAARQASNPEEAA
jgi:hypothetical protein